MYVARHSNTWGVTADCTYTVAIIIKDVRGLREKNIAK